MLYDFCSYNVRGLHKKISYVKDFISSNKFTIVRLLETHVKETNASYISSLVAPSFRWLFNYGSHSNGRIWFGWDPHEWSVNLLSFSAQHITCNVTSIVSQKTCTVSMVYAFNTYIERRNLWSDLVSIQNLIDDSDFNSWCLMGDFNTFLHPHETNGPMPRNLHSIEEFKQCLASLGVTDLHFTGHLLTWWDSNIENPTLRKLDRVLVNDSWLQTFTLSTVHFMSKGLSDHCPAGVSLGLSREKIFKPFQVFQHLIDNENFLPTVAAVWEAQVLGDPWFVLTMKLRAVKQGLKTMNLTYGNLHDSVRLATQQLKNLQDNMSSNPTSGDLIEEKRLCDILAEVLRNEEILLRQKSRIHWLKHGDGNNKYFFNSCKGRWNSNKILNLEDADGAVHSSHSDISEIATSYFKILMRGTPEEQIFPEDIALPTLLNDESELLEKPFEEADVIKTFKSMAKGKCPGPDGFTTEFYLAAWKIVGKDVVAAVTYFFNSFCLPRQVDSVAITLVPKVSNPSRMDQFRPISCCNTLYKCIAKMLTDRLKGVMNNIISPCQTAFVPGRKIGDNILLAQSLCRDYHLSSGSPRIAIKMDIRKAFDTLNWKFLFTAMQKMNFPSKFVEWVKICVSSAMFAVKVNGSLEGYFTAHAGLRQGDPLSPYLFVLAMEVLTACLNSTTNLPEFTYHWRTKAAGISHLIFADDLFLFCKGDIASVSALIRGVGKFSAASGLIPNPEKCLCFFGNVNSEVQDYTMQLTGFSRGTLPISYLGLPLVSGKVCMRDCEGLITRICKKIDLWTGKFLNQAGRVQLINAVLLSIQGYWATHLFLPKRALKKIQSILSHYLWGASISGPCQFKVAWQDCCYPKKEGGLGFKDLIIWNDAAVLHQIWRIVKKDKSLWITWLYETFFNSKPFWYMKIPSKCAWSLQKIFKHRDKCLPFVSYQIGSDSNFLLWNDPWLHGRSLLQTLGRDILSIMQSDNMEKVGSLFSSSPRKNANMMSNHVLAIEFRRLCSTITTHSRDDILWNGQRASTVSISEVWNTIRQHISPPPGLIWFGMVLR